MEHEGDGLPPPNKRRVRNASPELYASATRLRRALTRAERLLWNALRGRQLCGLRFRTQHPVDRFILDFYCPACKLAVELDGSLHDDPAVQEEDAARTEHLLAHGCRVLRFSNREVEQDLPGVLRAIAATAALSPPRPAWEREEGDEEGPRDRF